MWDELFAWASGVAPEKWMVLGAATAIALVAGFFIANPVLKHLYQRWQIRCRVGRMGKEVIENALIPDGMGRAMRIDYLVRSDRGITVVALRRYPGTIFAAENMEMWVQVVGNGSHKFPNPLPELRMQIGAVRALIPDVPVDGVLLFAHGSEFPKGKPAEVMTLDELREQQRDQDLAEAWPALESGWERLRSHNNELAAVETCS